MNTTLILGNKILTKNDVELRTLKLVSFLNYEHFVIFRHWDLMMPNELIMKPSRVRKVFIPYTSQAFLKQSSMKLKDRWYGASLMSLHKYCDSVQSNLKISYLV